MSEYIDFIIDKANKKILGRFNDAYTQCDSIWPNQFTDELPKHHILKSIINKYPTPVKILDIGCGYGYLVDKLSRNGHKAYGCDISSQAIKKGKELFGYDLNIMPADLTKNLPYEQCSFDVICCFGVLQYMPSLVNKAMNQIKRVLAVNGHILISISLPEDPIGKEWLPDYSSFLTNFAKSYALEGTLINYPIQTKELPIDAREILNPNNSDLLAWGKKI